MTFGEVLQISVMRRIWYAQIISLLGDFIAIFAVISVVSFEMHGTPAQVTGVQIAFMLPFSILGPLAGVFVDRWPLKPTLVASDLIRAVLVLMLFAAGALWQIYAVLIVLSAVSTMFAPAQSVTIRNHVPRHGLLSANALMQMAMMGVRIVGPATAGALVAKFGSTLCYSIDAISFIASACLIGSVKIVRQQETTAPSESANTVRGIWTEMQQGIRFILGHRALLFVVMAMAAGMFTIGCFGPLIAVFVRESLHAEAGVFGAVSAMIGLGLLVGTQLLRKFAMHVSNQVMVLTGLAGIGVGVFLLGAVAVVPATLTGMFIVGVAFSGIIVPAQTLMQQETPHALMGRIASSVMSVVFFAQLVGLVISGLLAQIAGVRAVFFMCAVMAGSLAAAGHVLLRPSPSTPR